MGISTRSNLELVNEAETIGVTKGEIVKQEKAKEAEKKQPILRDKKAIPRHMKRRDHFRAKDSETWSNRL